MCVKHCREFLCLAAAELMLAVLIALLRLLSGLFPWCSWLLNIPQKEILFFHYFEKCCFKQRLKNYLLQDSSQLWWMLIGKIILQDDFSISLYHRILPPTPPLPLYLVSLGFSGSHGSCPWTGDVRGYIHSLYTGHCSLTESNVWTMGKQELRSNKLLFT